MARGAGSVAQRGGVLLKSMYGSRDAAQNWERAYREMAERAGFRAGKFTPCVFHHPERKMYMVVHGDDITILGYDRDLDWFRVHISKH